VVSTNINKLLPIALISSLGAPFLYVGYAVIYNLLTGNSIDGSLFILMFGAALLFSLIVTLCLVLVTIIIAQSFKIRTVNVSLLSFGFVIAISVVIMVFYGFDQAKVFAILSFANATIFIALSPK
jgi:hypothetical protein